MSPVAAGLISRSLGSTGDFRENFCRMVVRKRNSSIMARLSPIQDRFPGRRKHHISSHHVQMRPESHENANQNTLEDSKLSLIKAL